MAEAAGSVALVAPQQLVGLASARLPSVAVQAWLPAAVAAELLAGLQPGPVAAEELLADAVALVGAAAVNEAVLLVLLPAVRVEAEKSVSNEENSIYRNIRDVLPFAASLSPVAHFLASGSPPCWFLVDLGLP